MLNRILLVEDDMYIALALKIRLKAEGYEVNVAHDRGEACRVARENPPDLALIDYNLPDGTGFEVMGHFSEDVRTASIKKIIMTASKQPGLRESAIAAGALELFEKPFKSIELIDYIQKVSNHGEQLKPESL
ncbi:response regulator [Granulosicoccus antarcticus]|uniref:Transcriptional regulatory protein YycF n=1 Tax=Granulosicoccus antarcticus IMCC3135 TaxID=1192854 RepID=A0A2Z2NUS3_9GAMM|nr:response regulator [Granulosicoccus antarcticus]ASJ75003.1 Transcriptional regulatory protein YycF [Granulosicoccus antarcticus IMCC3135]